MKQTVPDLKELFRQAAEVAQQVPESMQEAAFNRALELLVGEQPVSHRAGGPQTKQKPARGPAVSRPAENAATDLVRQIDSTRHPGVRSAAKVLDRALMVLQIALRDHGVDGLTPVDIARILTEKFRLSTTRQAVGMALKDASNLVDRVADGRGYRYRIMGPGEDYLAHVDTVGAEVAGKQPGATKPASKHRTKRSPNLDQPVSPKPSGRSLQGAAKKVRSAWSSSPKLGPKSAILSLVESGFFATAKTGPAVQDYLKTKRGFDLGTDQLRLAMLRLVRDGVLERDENDEGQYEYKRP